MKYPEHYFKKVGKDPRDGRFIHRDKITFYPGGIPEEKEIEIVKDKNMFIAIEKYGFNSRVIAAFPKNEGHFDKFRNAEKSWFTHEEYPGSVGVMLLSHNSRTEGFSGPMRTNETYWHIPYCQAGFRTGQKAGLIERPLATKYGGWRYRVLKEAVNIVSKTEDVLYIEKDVAEKGGFMQDLHKACNDLKLRRYIKQINGVPVETAYWKGDKKIVKVFWAQQPKVSPKRKEL